MNIVEQRENEYRSYKGYGVTFSIDASAYESRFGDRVEFGDNTTSMQGGALYNWQDVLLDGNVIGYLEERENGKLFDPMTVTFCVPLADCTEQELWEEKVREFDGNPHLAESGEVLKLEFATLNQMLEYLNV